MQAEEEYARPTRAWAVTAVILLYHLLHLLLLLSLTAAALFYLYFLITDFHASALTHLPEAAAIWWVTFQALTASVTEADDRELIDVTELPGLAAALEDAALRVDAPLPEAVRLTTDATIHATEDGGLLAGLVGGRRVLVIGAAALPYLTEEEFRCLLARALACWPRRESWYGVQARRLGFANTVLNDYFDSSRTRWTNPVYWLLQGYSALFGRLLAASLREQELRADEMAAEAYARDDVASALMKQCLFERFYAEQLAAKLRFGHRSLDNCWETVTAAAAGYAHWNDLWRQVLLTPGGPLSPQPGLAERVGSLKGPKALMVMPAMARAPFRPATRLFER